MPARSHYDPETQARAVRMYADRLEEGDGASKTQAGREVELAARKVENARLKRANEILGTSSAFSPRRMLDEQTGTIVAYIRQYRHRFGVEPICAVLPEHGTQIAPSTFYAHQVRGFPLSDRELADAYDANTLHTLWVKNRRLYGRRKLCMGNGGPSTPANTRNDRALPNPEVKQQT